MVTLHPEIKRKLFHLTGGVYLLAALSFRHQDFLFGLGIWVLLLLLIECLRLFWGPFKQTMARFAGSLFRPSEQNALTGVFWMALGVFVSALIIGTGNLFMASVLYLLLGDSAASLIGKGLKGIKWPHSEKSVSGSLGCFIVCLVVGVITLSPDYSWSAVVVGAFAATVLEFGFIPINDNFLIPAGVSIVFRLLRLA